MPIDFAYAVAAFLDPQRIIAQRIDVPRETIRNWEQGKRCPTGAARALLRVLDKVPETALRVLT